jgi:hypothetical protein
MISEGNFGKITLKHLLIYSILLSTTFISSCKKVKDSAPQFSGNYHFTTIEISQTGTYCTDTINYDGTITTNGTNKLKIVFKLSNSTPCSTSFDTGIINSNVDEEGNLSNPDYALNSTDHFTGKIDNAGQINLEVIAHYGMGGYYSTNLKGNKL